MKNYVNGGIIINVFALYCAAPIWSGEHFETINPLFIKERKLGEMDYFRLPRKTKEDIYSIYVQKEAIQSFKEVEKYITEMKLKTGEDVTIATSFAEMKSRLKDFIVLTVKVREGQVLMGINPKFIVMVENDKNGGTILSVEGSMMKLNVLEEVEKVEELLGIY